MFFSALFFFCFLGLFFFPFIISVLFCSQLLHAIRFFFIFFICIRLCFCHLMFVFIPLLLLYFCVCFPVLWCSFLFLRSQLLVIFICVSMCFAVFHYEVFFKLNLYNTSRQIIFLDHPDSDVPVKDQKRLYFSSIFFHDNELMRQNLRLTVKWMF